MAPRDRHQVAGRVVVLAQIPSTIEVVGVTHVVLGVAVHRGQAEPTAETA